MAVVLWRQKSPEWWPMHDFARHDLLYLDPAAAVTGDVGAESQAVIADWLTNGRPVIVCRPGLADGGISCGIPLPPEQGKKRIAFTADIAMIRRKTSLPLLGDCLAQLPEAQYNVMAKFLEICRTGGFQPQVFGSLAWQYLTGLAYRHEKSDIDLLFKVKNTAELRQLITLLRQFPEAICRDCDIEIMLWNGHSFSWREHESSSSSLLLKKLNGIASLKKSWLTFGLADPGLIAHEALQALHEELETYPKPGLVSYFDSGSHPDMNAGHFNASIDALDDYFKMMAEAGTRGAAMPELRRSGLTAEARMLEATGGVNTHRGAIFSLGLLVAAAGHKLKNRDAASLGDIVRRQYGADILADMAKTGYSHGQLVMVRYGVGGARAEAAAGFPSIYKYGLPAFRAAVNHERNARRVHCFYALLEHVEDTTLLYRGGMEGQAFGLAAAREFNRCGGVEDAAWSIRALDAHREFVRRNLSSGGVADLLAATIFIDRMEELWAD